MAMLLLSAFLLAPPPSPAAAPESQEIVVRARRKKCLIEVDERTLSNREFEDRAGTWIGKPVRVIASSRADIKCLSKVAFRLAEQGVRLIEFVDPREASREASPLKP